MRVKKIRTDLYIIYNNNKNTFIEATIFNHMYLNTIEYNLFYLTIIFYNKLTINKILSDYII